MHSDGSHPGRGRCLVQALTPLILGAVRFLARGITGVRYVDVRAVEQSIPAPLHHMPKGRPLVGDVRHSMLVQDLISPQRVVGTDSKEALQILVQLLRLQVQPRAGSHQEAVVEAGELVRT